MRKVWLISVLLLLALGVIHIAATPLFYKNLNVNAIWFASCGLMLVFQAFVNLLADRLKQRTGYLLAFGANLASLALVLVLAFLLREVQAFVGAFLGLLATVGSFCLLRRS